jgi:hypothetical protein
MSRAPEMFGVGAAPAKVVLIEREWLSDRMTAVLVREPIGVQW